MDVEIKFPEKDLKAMQDAIARSVGELGKPVEDAIRQAAYYLARSARKRTAVSPKKRRAYTNKDNTGRWNKNRYPYYREVWKKEGNKKGPETAMKWYLSDKTDSTHEVIKRSGLAKKSWGWMLPMIRYGGSNFASEVNKSKSGLSATIEMANKLPYIKSALKESEGAILLNEAMGVAARQMEKAIDRQSAKMMRG